MKMNNQTLLLVLFLVACKINLSYCVYCSYFDDSTQKYTTYTCEYACCARMKENCCLNPSIPLVVLLAIFIPIILVIVIMVPLIFYFNKTNKFILNREDDGSSYPPPVFFPAPPPTYNEESSQQANQQTRELVISDINRSVLSEPPAYTSQITSPWIYNSVKHQQVSDPQCQETPITQLVEQERAKNALDFNKTKTKQNAEDEEAEKEVQK